MRIDGLNRQELFERVGFDRRDRIDRGIVDEKIEAARGGESFGFPLQNRQIAEVAGRENGASGSEPVAEGARFGGALRCRQIMQEHVASALQERFADHRADPARAPRDERRLALEPVHDKRPGGYRTSLKSPIPKTGSSMSHGVTPRLSSAVGSGLGCIFPQG
jgi:hypothetical protein